MQEEIHFISNCKECPFFNSEELTDCNLDQKINMYKLHNPKIQVHKNCPLKNKQILITLKR